MEFIEASGFSSVRENYFDDSQFHMLQLYLMDRPDAGDIIKGSAKNEASDLSREAIKAMREIVKDL